MASEDSSALRGAEVSPQLQEWYFPTTTGAQVTARYGQLPKDPSTTWRARGFHTGTDYGVKSGSDAYAIAGGKVVKSGFDKGIGNYVSLETSPGHVVTYQHLGSVNVKPGQQIAGGYSIGKTGNTGSLSQGAHLHMEYNVNGQIVGASTYAGKTAADWMADASVKNSPANAGRSFSFSGSTKPVNAVDTKGFKPPQAFSEKSQQFGKNTEVTTNVTSPVSRIEATAEAPATQRAAMQAPALDTRIF